MDTTLAGLLAFFAVEIRNETQGGVRPATLASARDSLVQAPDDVVLEWSEGVNRATLIEQMDRILATTPGSTELAALDEDTIAALLA